MTAGHLCSWCGNHLVAGVCMSCREGNTDFEGGIQRFPLAFTICGSCGARYVDIYRDGRPYSSVCPNGHDPDLSLALP